MSFIYMKVFLIVDEVHCTLPHQDAHTPTSSHPELITPMKLLFCRCQGTEEPLIPGLQDPGGRRDGEPSKEKEKVQMRDVDHADSHRV